MLEKKADNRSTIDKVKKEWEKLSSIIGKLIYQTFSKRKTGCCIVLKFYFSLNRFRYL